MPSHQREKLLNLIVFFTKNTEKCYKTKLFKLLYYADFEHFRQTGRPMLGLRYVTWSKGPVPQEFWDELKAPKPDLTEYVKIQGQDEKLHFGPKKSFEKKFFTEREIKIIERLAYVFKEADVDDMVESTHLRNAPWDKTKRAKGMGAEIDYCLAFDNQPDTISQEVFKERQENAKVFHQLFG